MNRILRTGISIASLALLLNGCGDQDQMQIDAGVNPVANDVLFLVLGKMSLYDQSPDGDLSLRNYHFVAEIMPKADREIISGTLTSAIDASQRFEFNAEGNAFLAHGARTDNAGELHKIHPDGDYIFSYRTESGRMDAQTLALARREAIDLMPPPAKVIATQDSIAPVHSVVDPDQDLVLTWEAMQGNHRSTHSELDDLIFVLAFDCFGNNVAHSGRPYQGGTYLTFTDSEFAIPAAALEPGLEYTVIVEQATADVKIYQGVPGISTYATLTFVRYRTAGEPGARACPPSD